MLKTHNYIVPDSGNLCVQRTKKKSAERHLCFVLPICAAIYHLLEDPHLVQKQPLYRSSDRMKSALSLIRPTVGIPH